MLSTRAPSFHAALMYVIPPRAALSTALSNASLAIRRAAVDIVQS